MVALIEAGADATAAVPRFREAAAYALAGLWPQSQALVLRAEQRYPDSTLVRTVLGPTALGDAPLPDGGATEAPSAEAPAIAGEAPPGDRPLQLGDQADDEPSQARPNKAPRLGDPADRLRLRLDP